MDEDEDFIKKFIDFDFNFDYNNEYKYYVYKRKFLNIFEFLRFTPLDEFNEDIKEVFTKRREEFKFRIIDYWNSFYYKRLKKGESGYIFKLGVRLWKFYKKYIIVILNYIIITIIITTANGVRENPVRRLEELLDNPVGFITSIAFKESSVDINYLFGFDDPLKSINEKIVFIFRSTYNYIKGNKFYIRNYVNNSGKDERKVDTDRREL
ncbi:hypothetical protein B0T20DRAFT_398310 [Sordaria brevicollis]|uniref:Uncharacterized protein n=1 Tax=Sordaria brevicollis TaxID=83679 RepID=A0AAE0NRA9_SORBR|nr:hypothetical protein B0T20DRAFT_398310 [Sordaria brevicollis]